MLNFQKLERSHLPRLLPYFRGQERRLSNYSAGFLFMWGRYMDTHFAEAEGCLLLRRPLCRQILLLLSSLKGRRRCRRGARAGRARRILPQQRGAAASDRRPARKARPARRTVRGGPARLQHPPLARLLYDASSFRDYPGGRYSGQRNHVHKFEKTYPDHVFRTCEAEDLPAMQKFLCEYADTQYDKDDVLADEEMQGTFDILPHIAELGLYCGALYAGGKMVALSVGERCGDTMIIHIEKALRGVAGAYPAVAQAFARTFLCGRRALHQPRGRLGRRRAAQIQIAVPCPCSWSANTTSPCTAPSIPSPNSPPYRRRASRCAPFRTRMLPPLPCSRATRNSTAGGGTTGAKGRLPNTGRQVVSRRYPFRFPPQK